MMITVVISLYALSILVSFLFGLKLGLGLGYNEKRHEEDNGY